MSLIVLLLGFAYLALGAAGVALGVPNYEFGLGNTLILAGTVCIIGGLLLVAMSMLLRELRQLRLAPTPQGQPRALAKSAPAAVSGEERREPPISDLRDAGPMPRAPEPAQIPAPPAVSEEPPSEPKPDAAEAVSSSERWPEHPLRLAEQPASAAARKSEPEPAAKGPRLIKSGIVDGLAYSLYSDGSIEADFKEGRRRFRTIDELQEYLAQAS